MMDYCPRCGTERMQDIRTWTYINALDRHICPICVFQGAKEEDPKSWSM